MQTIIYKINKIIVISIEATAPNTLTAIFIIFSLIKLFFNLRLLKSLLYNWYPISLLVFNDNEF